MRWNKKAQFFLIAALILSAIILSLGKVYNTSRIESVDTQVEDFSEELQYEASRVLDNGILQDDEDIDIEANLEQLTAYYSARSPDSDIDIIFGDADNLQTISYDGESRSTVVANISAQEDTDISVRNGKVNFKIKLREFVNQRRNQLEDRLERKLALNRGQGQRSSGEEDGETDEDDDDDDDEPAGLNRIRERVVEREFELNAKQNFYVVVKRRINNDQVTIIR